MIPKNFIPQKNAKLKIENPKNTKKSSKVIELDELIIDKTEFGYSHKVIEKFETAPPVLEMFGVALSHVKNTTLLKYGYDKEPDNSIYFVEYDSKSHLEEDLDGIFECCAGQQDEVLNYFLFRDNIAIFIIDAEIEERAIQHYRDLGFKQLKRVYKVVQM